MESEKLKAEIRTVYAKVAQQDKDFNQSSCCGSSCCSPTTGNLMNETYDGMDGYSQDADLGLGCGLPTKFANIKEGDTVIDLGSGAGNDCFVARAETGISGKVIGVDFTPEMIVKARQNNERLGYNNVEFRLGDIESMPISDHIADVVLSNCVLNLVPDKAKVFAEIFRILKYGGHFSISDIMLEGTLPEPWRKVVALYAGCVSGAIQKNNYFNLLKNVGFIHIIQQKEREILLPDDILLNYFTEKEIVAYRNRETRLLSVTVYGEKPIDGRCKCASGKGCC